MMGSTSVTQPFNTVSIDTMCPFPEDPSGNKYLIVIIDIFKCWIELFPAPSTEAESAATALMACTVYRHRLPRTLRSDHGTQFVNNIIETLL